MLLLIAKEKGFVEIEPNVSKTLFAKHAPGCLLVGKVRNMSRFFYAGKRSGVLVKLDFSQENVVVIDKNKK